MTKTYDVVIGGGGIAGSTLGMVLAQQGMDVLVLERTREFKDRVRGEGVFPWGVAEARELGIYDLLKATCAHELRYWSQSYCGQPPDRRDLPATGPHGVGVMSFFHPQMQQVLIEAAADAGCEVLRGATVVEVEPGAQPAVKARSNGAVETFSGRLVVGADGRSSVVRSLAGFKVLEDPPRMMVSGVLQEGIDVADDAVQMVMHPGYGQVAMVYPLSGGRFRTYFGYNRVRERPWLSGADRMPDFRSACIETGAPVHWYESAQAIGPLATFDGSDRWVEHPYREGIALVGASASANDPTFGCGLAMTLRDIRTLRDALSEHNDLHTGAAAYADQHDQAFDGLHRITTWLTDLFYDLGPQADARRGRALPRIAQDPTLVPDVVGVGPDAPHDEAAYRSLFGLD